MEVAEMVWYEVGVLVMMVVVCGWLWICDEDEGEEY